MTHVTAAAERVLILAPFGRDAAVAAQVVEEAGLLACICPDVPALCAALDEGAGLAVVAEEALLRTELSPLAGWIAEQPPWSDLPFVLMAQRGGGLERNPAAQRLSAVLGNVTFLERPFHPTTLVSIAQTALRGRLRQYEARERIEEIRQAEARLEARVAERTAELEAANRRLADQIAERERVEQALSQSQRLEAVGQLTSGVAHDFNNLLMVVLGNLRQLEKTEESPAVLRRYRMMLQAAERGAQLTRQMLAFSRREKLAPTVVDLNETVRGMRDLLQSSMGGSVDVHVELHEGLWPAMIDPTQIELVILNLAINARDAMEIGGRVTVATDNVVLGPPERPEEPAAGEYVAVCVSDTGTGMTPEVLAKAFEPFFTTKGVGKGSGLGLSQVYGLAKQSGGGVRIETEVGRGSRISVYLPRADVAVGAAAVAGAGGPAKADGHSVVLLVDDDDAVREVTAGMLETLGYQVLASDDGQRAVALVEEGAPVDLVLTDFAMPGMNGAQVARELHARRPDLPVLFATGYADHDALADAGEDRVVRKPFTEGELAAKLDRLLRQPSP